jgi:hypothetical protein
VSAPIWLDVVGDIATAGAATFAAYAIWQSRRQAEKSARALIAERRADYEISVLRDLAENVWRSPNIADRNDRCRLLLNLSPADLPIARAHFNVGQSETGSEAHTALLDAARGSGLVTTDDAVRPYIIAEIKEAIAASITRRPH